MRHSIMSAKKESKQSLATEEKRGDEAPIIEVEGIKPDALELATEAISSAGTFEQRLDELIRRIEPETEGAMGSEAKQLIVKLRALKGESARLKKSFLTQLADIINKPFSWLESVIADWFEKKYKIKDEASEENLENLDSSELMIKFERVLNDPTTRVEICFDYYDRALDAKIEILDNITNLLYNRVLNEIRQYSATDGFERLLALYDRLPVHWQRDKNHILPEMAKCLLSPLFESIDKSDNFSYSVFVNKKKILDHFSSIVASQIGTRRILLDECENYFEKNIAKILSPWEFFLSEQNSIALNGLGDFNSETQNKIVNSWYSFKARGVYDGPGRPVSSRENWPAILSHEKRAVLVPLFLEHPEACEVYIKHFDYIDEKKFDFTHDVDVLVRIADEFSPPERKVAWEKAGNQIVESWDDVYTILVLAAESDFDTVEISLLTSNQKNLGYLFTSFWIYGRSKARALLTKTNFNELRMSLNNSGAKQADFGNLKSLPEAWRRHLPALEELRGAEERTDRYGNKTKFAEEGIVGNVEMIYSGFWEAVELIPEKFRSDILNLLLPCPMPKSPTGYSIDEKKAKNFIRFCKLTNSANKFTLNDFICYASQLDPKHFGMIERGVEKCAKLGFTPYFDGADKLLVAWSFYERASQYPGDDIIEFLKVSQDEHAGYFVFGDRLLKRDTASTKSLFEFGEYCRGVFAKNTESVLRFSGLSIRHQEVIRQWISGDMSNKIKSGDCFDLPLIEGLMIAANNAILDFGGNKMEQIAKFSLLSTGQQELYWYLKRVMSLVDNQQEIYDLVESGDGQKIKELLTLIGDQSRSFYLPEIKLMLGRPDCWSLFAGLSTDLAGNIRVKFINKLIELVDNGLPGLFFESSSGGKISFDFRYPNTPTIFCEYDTNKMIQAARFFEKYNGRCNLADLARIDPKFSEAEVEMSVQMYILTGWFNASSISSAPTESEVERASGRVGAVKKLLQISGPFNQRWGEVIFSMPDIVWEKVRENKLILQNLLTSNRPAPRRMVEIPNKILESPLYWRYFVDRYEFPVNLSDQDCNDLLVALNLLSNQKIESPPDPKLILRAYQNNPWFFKPEHIEVWSFVGAAVRALLDLSEADLKQFMEFYSNFEFKLDYDIAKCAVFWRSGKARDCELILKKVRKYVNKIDWRDFQNYFKEIKVEADVERQVQILDDHFSERVAINAGSPHTWEESRAKFLYARIAEYAPSLGEDISFTVSQWKLLAELPPNILSNLEKIDLRIGIHEFTDHDERLIIAIAIAIHPNFEWLLKMMSTTGGGQGIFRRDIFLMKPKEIAILGDRITGVVADGIANFPHGIILGRHFSLEHLLEFVSRPDANSKFAFVHKARELLGDQYEISIYDLFFIDLENQLESLSNLSARSILPITMWGLANIKDFLKENDQKLVGTLLGEGGKTVSDDWEVLRDLSPELAYKTLDSRISRTKYDWTLFSDRKILIDELGLSADQVENLVEKMFVYRRDIPEFNFDIVSRLLMRSGDDNYYLILMKKITDFYKGDVDPIMDIIYKSPDLIARFISALGGVHNWGSSNIEAKYFNNEKFWLIIRDNQFLSFSKFFAWRHPAVQIGPEIINRIINGAQASDNYGLLDLSLQNKVELRPEERDLAVVNFINNRGDISDWHRQEKYRQLLEQQLAVLADQFTVSSGEPTTVAASLVELGLLKADTRRPVRAINDNKKSDLLANVMLWPEFSASALNNNQLDIFFGTAMAQISSVSPEKSTIAVRQIVKREFGDVERNFKPTDGELLLNDDNWMPILLAFIRTTIDDFQLPAVNSSIAPLVIKLFESGENKDFCLKRLQSLWQECLRSIENGHISARLLILTKFIENCEGAGPLTQIEALALFISPLLVALGGKDRPARTKKEIMLGLKVIEEQFDKERWDNTDRSDFYNISSDVVLAAPSLLADFLKIFEHLKPAELRKFHEEIFPLFRAELAVISETKLVSGEAVQQYNPRQLVAVRRDLRTFSEKKEHDDADFDNLKTRLIENITKLFKKRFGIVRVPENFTADNIRSITNITLYLANLNDRDEDKERMLGWFLALVINNKWDEFRQDKDFDPAELLNPKYAQKIAEILMKRRELNPLTPESLNIPPEEMAEFQNILQTETVQMSMGDVETVDVKLGNIIANLKTLEDPDLYPDQIDKDRLALVLKFGNKKVGAVVAKTYQGLTRADRSITLTEEERAIQDEIKKIISDNKLELTPGCLKELFQDGLKTFSLIANIDKFVEDSGTVHDIDELRRALIPTARVMEIFKRLGEDFKPSSGAFALTHDLDYLDNIIVKKEDKLEPGEKEDLQEYVEQIRKRVVKLENDLDKIKKKFAEINNANLAGKNPVLVQKIAEISGIFASQTVQRPITSTCTNNLNGIIENIRECLSCKRAGSNNDTDLTFGDSNKFFIYSNTESQHKKGSIADQIVFVEPIRTTPDSPQSMSFVLDHLYGNAKTPFILTNHILTVLKKYRALKERFPSSTISVFVTDSAMAGVIEPSLLAERLGRDHSDLKIELQRVDVDVAQSALADHYIEFGGDARKNGVRPVKGLLISL